MSGDGRRGWRRHDHRHGDDGDYEVCGYAECTDSDLSSTLKVEVRADANAEGTFGNPFERVDFWVSDENGASWLVGSDTSGTRGRVGGADDNSRNRTWSYSITVPGTTLRMVTRPDTGGDRAANMTIHAIGVNDKGVGLATTVALVDEDFGEEKK